MIIQDQVLRCLSDGRARTIREIASFARASLADVNDCLAQLPAADLRWDRQHRHEYVSLRRTQWDEVDPGALSQKFGPREGLLQRARTCYGHFAGDFGIAVTDYLTHKDIVELREDGYWLTSIVDPLFTALKVDPDILTSLQSAAHKRCLDWAHRRPHIGGKLGRLLVDQAEAQGWIKRGIGHARAVQITDLGHQHLSDLGF